MSASSLPGSNLKRAAESPSEARPPKQSRPDVSSSTEEVTEAEAALYDRQIRLWGLAAQNRMRKSHILVHNLQGIATEVIKNIVLSGIGRLTLLDPVPVAPEDLASGFFFREDDVGQLRVEVAKDRIQKLNPLVRIDCQSDPYLLTDAQRLKELDVDVIVSTAGSRQEWTQLNALARTLRIRFYAAQAQGLNGWFFSDLGPAHRYLVESAGPEGRRTKSQFQQAFVPFETALNTTWPSMTPRLAKRLQLKPGFFATLAHFTAPASGSSSEFKEVVYRVMKQRGVPPEALLCDSDWDKFLTGFLISLPKPGTVGLGDFAPTSAVLGGLVGQDVLNALGGSQPPMANFVYLEGLTGNALVYKLGITEPRKLEAADATGS